VKNKKGNEMKYFSLINRFKLPALFLYCSITFIELNAQLNRNHDFYPGDYSHSKIIGNRLPGTWRPFSDDSPWNTPIPEDAKLHPNSSIIIETMASVAENIRFANSYTIPVWTINSDNMEFHIADSPYPFDTWDQNYDGITEAGVPIDSTMWGEQTPDGHICIIDPFKMLAWEMSRFKGIKNDIIDCSTFNIWDLTSKGVGDPHEGRRWTARGGRGSGFLEIAGLIRPEEIFEGEIRHALVFIFSKNQKNLLIPPACRCDGKYVGDQYPIEGMRFQLDPFLTDEDFDRWGLIDDSKIIAKALQKYGMFVGDNGGAMALQPQLLHKDIEKHRTMWDSLCPGLYENIKKIPTNKFRLIYTGDPVRGGSQTRVITPLILPLCGKISDSLTISISTPTPDAKITYTTDGTSPTMSSIQYLTPLRLYSSVTIKAKAFCEGHIESGITRAPFIKDTSITRINMRTGWNQNLELYNYPNPFNSTTKISYLLPNSNFVILKVYNILGEEFHTLVNEFQKAGIYSTHFNVGQISSEIYICTFQAGDLIKTKKMLVMK
jgi:hypothetical protein